MPVLRVWRKRNNCVFRRFFWNVIGPVDVAEIGIDTDIGLVNQFEHVQRGPTVVDNRLLMNFN